MAAISFAAILPLIVVGILLERFIIKGMSAGPASSGRVRLAARHQPPGALTPCWCAARASSPASRRGASRRRSTRTSNTRNMRPSKSDPMGSTRRAADVAGHRLGRNHQQLVRHPRGRAVRLRGHHQDTRPGARATPHERRGGGQLARPGRAQEQVPRAQRERRHVPLHAHGRGPGGGDAWPAPASSAPRARSRSSITRRAPAMAATAGSSVASSMPARDGRELGQPPR